MRARKVAILLAITALSALTLFFILLVDTDALGAEINRSDDPVMVPRQKPDSKYYVEVFAEMGDGSRGDLRLSCPVPAAIDFLTLSDSWSLLGKARQQSPRKADNCASFQIKPGIGSPD